jgi:hypothetical protein
VGPKSRSGGFGLGGMKSSGSNEVGLMESDMPTLPILKGHHHKRSIKPFQWLED